jgi:hypothetical protein
MSATVSGSQNVAETYTPDTPSFGMTTDEIERQRFLTTDSQDNQDNSIKASFRDKLASLYHDNTGLLLVISSQLFFTFMNLFVKLLTAMDNPVHALEVRTLINIFFQRSLFCSSYGYEWYGCFLFARPAGKKKQLSLGHHLPVRNVIHVSFLDS